MPSKFNLGFILCNKIKIRANEHDKSYSSAIINISNEDKKSTFGNDMELEDSYENDEPESIGDGRGAEYVLSVTEWLKHLEDNFIPLIVDGLEAQSRGAILKSLEEGKELDQKEIMLLIHSQYPL